jgi:hypothetical protein
LRWSKPTAEPTKELNKLDVKREDLHEKKEVMKKEKEEKKLALWQKVQMYG